VTVRAHRICKQTIRTASTKIITASPIDGCDLHRVAVIRGGEILVHGVDRVSITRTGIGGVERGVFVRARTADIQPGFETGFFQTDSFATAIATIIVHNASTGRMALLAHCDGTAILTMPLLSWVSLFPAVVKPKVDKILELVFPWEIALVKTPRTIDNSEPYSAETGRFRMLTATRTDLTAPAIDLNELRWATEELESLVHQVEPDSPVASVLGRSLRELASLTPSATATVIGPVRLRRAA
jgi:hypothetical protein